MKHTPIAILLFLGATACTVTSRSVDLTPELRLTFSQLEAQEVSQKAAVKLAQAEVESAQTTPDLADDATAAQKLEEARSALAVTTQQLAQIESDVLRNRAAPWVGVVAQTAGPAGLAFLPGILGLLPMLSKRGRKHYGDALKNVTPGLVGTNGSPAPSPILAAQSVLKAWGLMHSSPASEAAAGT